MADRIQAIRNNLVSGVASKKSIFVFDLKHVYKILYLATGIVVNFDSCLMDPKVAIWLEFYVFLPNTSFMPS